MLNDSEVVAMIAVTDIHRAATFYETTLGLRRETTEGAEVITYRSGATRLNIYRSEFAGTNKATAVLWNVGKEIGKVAAALAAKGVRFEHYDMPGMTVTDGMYSNDNMKVAWFKDPDGNILSIVGV
ncbi:VOC family protein [Massilia sp. CF038]|uniref:VOC family protein n=1 Tax=Massilia sp. CF038 TaxID=1881045 RepID=UPI0009117F62|nr:VOC family protein [Massilia sp. CF038]SHG72979.1 Glyoxalase/Bleomycin resistance protein/Dioxygenase superfamily protein [Massilia sp. CF038]